MRHAGRDDEAVPGRVSRGHAAHAHVDLARDRELPLLGVLVLGVEADLGLSASARDRMVQACYQRVNLISFLTAGEDECRAWTIPANTDAVTAAGQIHSDIARGFIRAETVSFADLKAHGDMKGVKAAGRTRLEGKSYIVQDGDIINFRFAV